jgi:hypothetical protein
VLVIVLLSYLMIVLDISIVITSLRVDADTSYLTGVALPMILIGLGQGGALAPLTSAGISGVEPDDAGAASGLVNVAHQLGGSLGLAVLVTVFASADGDGPLAAPDLLAHRIASALTGSAVILALALLVVVASGVRPARSLRATAAPAVAAGSAPARS